MDKKALTEQRRETVIGLLKSMNIKKSTVGGFDKEDVYKCMQQLCELYEKSIEELESSYESEIAELKDRYQKYDENNELYISLIMEAKKSSNEIINQAKDEVETILAEGKEKVAKQEEDLENMRAGMEAEKDVITAELNASRDAVEAEKVAMKAEVEAEKEKVAALKNKYKKQVNDMEEEFSEIKTNILRTAGKIDSIKSKVDEDADAEWSIIKDLDAIDSPAEGERVERTVNLDEIVPDTTMDTDSVDTADMEAAKPEGPAEASEAVGDIFPEIDFENFGESQNDDLVDIPDMSSAAADDTNDAGAAAGMEASAPLSEEGEEEFTLEDLISDSDEDQGENAPAPEEPGLDDIEIELPDIGQEAEQEPEQKAEQEPPQEDDVIDEISFEGLEDLFSDEND